MSELINVSNSADRRWQLLASVSAFALAALVPGATFASDDARPTVWVELGGQWDKLTNEQESFAPPFVAHLLENPFTPPAEVQASPQSSLGEEASIALRPDGSDWVVSASVRYGRANRKDAAHEETMPASAQRIISIPAFNIHSDKYYPAGAMRFASTASERNDTHLVLDFKAGKDVGLGLFGKNGSSIFSAGVRFAQFTSRSKVRIDSDPDFAVTYKYATQTRGVTGYFKIPHQIWDLYTAKQVMSRSFTGFGPSIDWTADATLLGNPAAGSVTFDWGVNAAILFGRQKVHSQHITTAHHANITQTQGPLPTLYPTRVSNLDRSRSVVVPNVGGFAGLSVRYPIAKISIGYRVDAFLGAMDGGQEVRKTYDRNFYGPFATISIGLGG
jgi:hypothetical protein